MAASSTEDVEALARIVSSSREPAVLQRAALNIADAC
jgi:hypothetical protein